MSETKLCKKCGIAKPTSDFGKYSAMKDGLHWLCKVCWAEYQRTRSVKIPVSTKCCEKCNIIKPSTEFYKDHRHKDGLKPVCKSCRKAEQKSYLLANPDKTKICTRCNTAKPLIAFVLRGASEDGLDVWCKDCASEYRHGYYLENAEAFRKYAAKQRQVKPGANREYLRQWRPKNREKCREYYRKWCRENPIAAKKMAGRANSKRRAHIFNAPGSFTDRDIEHQFEMQNGCCFWCSQVFSPDWEIDHVIPISRNGSNWSANLVCACPHCNASKRDKLPYVEWQPPNPLQPLEYWLETPGEVAQNLVAACADND